MATIETPTGQLFVDADYWKPEILVHGAVGTRTPAINGGNNGNNDNENNANNDIVGTVTPPPNSSDIVSFLYEQLNKTNATGYWRRSHGNPQPRNGAPNPNIIGMWRDLGFYGFTQNGTTDYIAWCAGFTYWCLMRCGYVIPKTASAKYIAQGNNAEKIGYAKVSLKDASPGDLCVWGYSHINIFVGWLDQVGGRMKCIGGNQTAKGGSKSLYNNNPSHSDVTLNIYNPGRLYNPNILYRPRKA